MDSHNNTRLHASPETELDRIFESYDDALPHHVEILVTDHDVTELDAQERAAKRLRIRGHAAAYLMNRPIRLQSTALKGPLDGWKNPWARKRPAREQKGRRNVSHGNAHKFRSPADSREGIKGSKPGQRPTLARSNLHTKVDLDAAEKDVDPGTAPVQSSPDHQLLDEARNIRKGTTDGPEQREAEQAESEPIMTPSSNYRHGLFPDATNVPAAENQEQQSLDCAPYLTAPESNLCQLASEKNACLGTDTGTTVATSQQDVVMPAAQEPSNEVTTTPQPLLQKDQNDNGHRSPLQATKHEGPRLEQRRRLSFNNTPIPRTIKAGLDVTNVAPMPVASGKTVDGNEALDVFNELSTQAALAQAQASFKNIMTPFHAAHYSPPPHNGDLGSPQTSPTDLPAITPFRAFGSLLSNEKTENICTQALFDDARNLTFSTVKKPAPERPQPRISQAFRISKTGSHQLTSPKSSSAKVPSRPATQESLAGSLDIDAALDDMSQFLDVSDLPDDMVKQAAGVGQALHTKPVASQS